MEAEDLEGLTRNYVANGTKRKLDWLTDDVAVDKIPRLTESTATEAADEQSDFPGDSGSDEPNPYTSQS
jgi:hypothetical protein